MHTTPGLKGARRLLGAATVGAVATLLPLQVAVTQQRASRQPPELVNIIDADGGGPDFDARTVRRGFDLFSPADAAFSGMRATGNFGTAISNYGDCNGTLRNCQNNRVQRPNGTFAPYFEVEWAYGVPPSQFVKIRNVAPSVTNAGGGGWMAAYNRTVLGLPKRFSPRDGTLGRMFSGTTSTEDGSCRDHTGFTNGFYLGGLQILPASDCAETWGGEGWTGAHPIDQAGFKQWFDVQGDAFTFDFNRVPEVYQRLDKQFMGTRHHTYGETSDFSSDVLTNYGGVVPGGSGAPVYQGYPLGLLIHFEAFNFAVPTVASSYFVQATIVNRSEDVWGAPIDYDSLYFGLSMGGLFSNQNHSAYALPERGMVVYHNSGVLGSAGPCGDPNRQPYAGNACSTGGYGSGATGIIFLRSPIGDLRNKLFTRTTAGAPCTVGVDPFCSPSHPLRGDTITFMRQTYGDFGGADAATWGTSTRAAFGLMSGIEENTLDGRSITDFNERTQWRTFRSEFWPTIRAHHNKYVPPGNWDYNKDGILDTLVLDTCGQNGCVVVDSDTMPSGHVNNRGNIGGLQSLGPISLAAGDSVTLIYAHVGDADAAQFFATVDAVIDLYMNFYLAPEAPPPVRVVSTFTNPGTDQFGTANPTVAITFSDDPERWTDPFLAKVASDVENAAPGTPLAALRDLNDGRDITIMQIDTLFFDEDLDSLVTDTTLTVVPSTDLVTVLQDRATNNFERLEVYKSCDGGDSFTADGDCDGDLATTVGGVGDVFGWRAYAILNPAANGDFPNAFADAAVDGGRSYLYVFIGKSRGATFLLNTPSGQESVSFAPEIRNPLSRSTSDPNVVSVYVPASKQSGYQAARVNFTSSPTATVPFVLGLSDNVVTASYRAVFGNEILVERDSLISSGTPLRSLVTIRRRANVDVGGVPTSTIVKTERFDYSSSEVFLVAGSGADAGSVSLGDTVRTGTLYSGLGFVIAGNGEALFGSTTLDGTGTTPASLFGRAEFPGFVITANNGVAGDHVSAAEAQLRGTQSIAELGLLPTDTLVPRTLVNSFMVQWREASSTRTADGGGLYEVSWADDPWGVGRGFVLNLNNPGATEAEVQATLAARELPTTGLTDAETAALLAVDQTDLVAVKLPFTIRNLVFDRPVDVAMTRRLSNRVALGNQEDTVTVVVQEDQWIPGDALYLIENVVEDSVTAAGLVLDGSGQPVQRTRRAMTFSTAVFGCDQIRQSCNPVLQTSPGATGYNPMRAGDRTQFGYYVGFSPTSEYGFDVVAPVRGDQITALTDSALALIRVVPNPFVIFSQYQSSLADSRVLFTNVPPRGTIRIYTVAGQFVQQITWEPADLEGDGDLFWDLKSREGIDIASGLYLWVLTAPRDPTNPNGTNIQARGKFVAIRGNSR